MTQRGLARIAFIAALACVLVVFPGKGFRHSVEQKQKHTPTRGFFHAQASVTVAPAHATRETDRSGSMWVQLVQVLPRDRWALHETTSFSWALGTDRGPPTAASRRPHTSGTFTRGVQLHGSAIHTAPARGTPVPPARHAPNQLRGEAAR